MRYDDKEAARAIEGKTVQDMAVNERNKYTEARRNALVQKQIRQACERFVEYRR